MGNRQFSLAVVKGASAGSCIQSARKRVSVGSAIDNDLVMTDQGVAPRHYLVVIDGKNWRVHGLSDDRPIRVVENWRHPEGGIGALVHAGPTTVLLFPGELSQKVIAEEIATRSPMGEADMPTAIDLPRAAVDRARGLTKPVVPVNVDEVEMAAMDTVAARPPGDLRSAARQMLEDRRAGVQVKDVDAPPENQSGGVNPWEDRTIGVAAVRSDQRASAPDPAKSQSRKSAWDRAKKPPVPEPESSVPEILATPESQVMRAPGSEKSSMRPAPKITRAPAPNVEEPSPRSGGRSNAWGDKPAGTPNRAEKALVPTSEPRNAWGDRGAKSRQHSRQHSRQERFQQQQPPHPRQRGLAKQQTNPGSGLRIDLAQLAARGDDPALHILRNPDGEYATAIRLLGARIQEFSSNLGYRAFMLSSAEPLTGKTTAAVNLALALAEDTHRKVALIEANFRYPRLGSILGVDESRGLLPVLDGRARVGDAGIRVNDRNLVLLPTGGRHAAPAEVLASPRFKSLLSELVETVDVAIIDAPSATPFADTNLILPLVDAAFMVVAEGLTKRAWLGQAVARLGERRLLGSLFNRIPPDERAAIVRDRKERMRD